MKHRPYTYGPMSQKGSALLKVIMNDYMPLTDLLARESIQNSLDARDENSKVLHVDYFIRNIDPRSSGRFLQELNYPTIQSSLQKKYPSGFTLLEVRDTGTKGLGGPIATSEINDETSQGDFIKLVYQMGHNQERQDAGGSWGYGKTVYYRLGVGLVLFYSRVKEGGRFQSRLAGCMIENEKNPDRLMKKSKTGICWWGSQDDVPMTRESEIKRVLDHLGVKPFGKEEVGTSIIIPYLNVSNILNVSSDSDEDDQVDLSQKPFWEDDLGKSLNISIQRWYALRINNLNWTKGPILSVSVDGERVETTSAPVFNYMQQLYNYIHEKEHSLNNDKVKVFKVTSKFIVGDKAGTFAFVELSKNDLRMVSPENLLDPFSYIYGSPSNENHVIIGMARSPGMIVQYSSQFSQADSSWTRGLLPVGGGGYHLGLFIPNSDGTLTPKIVKSTMNPHSMPEGCKVLEEYYRSTEQADHSRWEDSRGVRLIQTARRKIIDFLKINSQPVVDNEQDGERGMQMSRLMGKILPPDGFGKEPPNRPKVGRNPTPQRPSKTKSSDGFEVIGRRFPNEKTMQIIFEVSVKMPSLVKLKLGIGDSDNPHSGLIEHLDDWEMGDLPFVFSSVDFSGEELHNEFYEDKLIITECPENYRQKITLDLELRDYSFSPGFSLDIQPLA
jgi:hypothetical protein